MELMGIFIHSNIVGEIDSLVQENPFSDILSAMCIHVCINIAVSSK